MKIRLLRQAMEEFDRSAKALHWKPHYTSVALEINNFGGGGLVCVGLGG